MSTAPALEWAKSLQASEMSEMSEMAPIRIDQKGPKGPRVLWTRTFGHGPDRTSAMSQYSIEFAQFDSELGLAEALLAKTGKDLFKGLTHPADRQAAARISIIMNRLEAEFGPAYLKVYGEQLPQRQRINPVKPPKEKRA